LATIANEEIGNHSKWVNNYDYTKSIYLVNREPHLDTGFLLLRKSADMVSPLAVLYYEEYNDSDSLNLVLESNKEKIQCIVSGKELGNIHFGQTQCPKVWDYADGVDTLKFLEKI